MFSNDTFTVLAELAANNDRSWFERNRGRYETLVREPAIDFISAMIPALAEFAPYFRADPRKQGGSLMRVYRDTRFGRDKTPFKTNIGIQFRHTLGRDVHAPGFYLHLSNDGCFFGTGCWRPDATALGAIREHIAANPAHWFAARDNTAFLADWTLDGERLSRPPRAYPANHPAIEDLKRKDYVGLSPLDHADAIGPDLPALASARFAAAKPLMVFLCTALRVPY